MREKYNLRDKMRGNETERWRQYERERKRKRNTDKASEKKRERTYVRAI